MNDTRTADAVTDNWVDRSAPKAWRPYLRMARLDRPIGWWLLLLPCWAALALAGAGRGFQLYDLWLVVAFVIGAIAMRGAGCCLNDIVDRDIDSQVERTRARPIPSGAVSVRQATLFMASLCLVGLFVLLTMNWTAFWVALASLVLVAIYPFMKRVTYWPQLFLGLAFNWGAWVGWAAKTGEIAFPALWLWLGGICWTIFYDTIYAHQDREDDALIGVKSTALKFGERTESWLSVFFGGAVFCFGAAILSAGLPLWCVLLLIPFALHLLWQLRELDIDDGAGCLALFRANRDAGLLLAAAFLVASLMA